MIIFCDFILVFVFTTNHHLKRWPTDLAVVRSSPSRGKIFSTVDGVPLHTTSHRPGMTENC